VHDLASGALDTLAFVWSRWLMILCACMCMWVRNRMWVGGWVGVGVCVCVRACVDLRGVCTCVISSERGRVSVCSL
jgi:hypothetical protein